MAGTHRILTHLPSSEGHGESVDVMRQQDWPTLHAPELVILNDPKTLAAEAIRSLYSQLNQKSLPNGRKTFAILADASGRGASFVAANLALAFAQSGYRTALIDANLSKPRLGSLFELDPHVQGLSDWLVNLDVRRRQRYGATPYRNLSLLPAGTSGGAELLLNRAMLPVMAELARLFDVVIYDAPDAGEASAAMALAGKADQTILVGRQHATKASALTKLEKQVTECGGTVAGVVLSKF